MNKEQFFNELNKLLKALPEKDRNKANTYYNEIINDYIEDGMAEEIAIEKLGDIHSIADEILSDNGKNTNKGSSVGSNILIGTLLVLGFPLWGSLLLAGALLLLSFYIILFCPIIIFGALAIAFLASSILCTVTAMFIFLENIPYGIFQLGIGIIFFGLSIIFGWLLIYTTKHIFKFYSFTWKKISALFKKRGA